MTDRYRHNDPRVQELMNHIDDLDGYGVTDVVVHDSVKSCRKVEITLSDSRTVQGVTGP